MATAIAIALGALLVLAALVTLLLAVPLDVEARARRERGLEWEARVVWLFGLVRKDLHAEEEPEAPDATEAADADRKPRRRGGFRALRAALRTDGFTDAVRRFLRRARQSVHVRDAGFDVRFGTGDPMETGVLFGGLVPVVASISAIPGVREVRLQPDFLDEGVFGQGHGAMRAFPLVAVAAAVRFALTPASIRAYRNARRARRA